MRNTYQIREHQVIDFNTKGRQIGRLPNPGEVIQTLETYVETITTSNIDNDLIVGFCFGYPAYRSSYKIIGTTMLVFPIYDQIEYKIKKGDFWINQGKDPITIHPQYYQGDKHFDINTFLLFSRIPFESANPHFQDIISILTKI